MELHDRGLIAIISHTFYKITEFLSLKMWAAGGAVIYSFLFGDLPYAVAFSLVLLVIFDMITGIVASKVSGVIISSRHVFATAGKLAIYGLLISAGHLTNVIIGFDFKLDSAIMVVLAFTEIISILENAGKMGYKIPKKMLNKVRDYRESL